MNGLAGYMIYLHEYIFEACIALVLIYTKVGSGATTHKPSEPSVQ